MPRTPMTPEKFQTRDVKRRISSLEKKSEYRTADITRMMVRIKQLEKVVLELDVTLQILIEVDRRGK